MDGTVSHTFGDALEALAVIVARMDAQLAELSRDKTQRRRSARLKAERDAVNAALDELREGPDGEAEQDVADVPPAVAELAEYLVSPYVLARPPVHPYGGGHCRICAVVGHLVAHPGRDCAGVGCQDAHDATEWASPAAITWGRFEDLPLAAYPADGPIPD